MLQHSTGKGIFEICTIFKGQSPSLAAPEIFLLFAIIVSCCRSRLPPAVPFPASNRIYLRYSTTTAFLPSSIQSVPARFYPAGKQARIRHTAHIAYSRTSAVSRLHLILARTGQNRNTCLACPYDLGCHKTPFGKSVDTSFLTVHIDHAIRDQLASEVISFRCEVHHQLLTNSRTSIRWSTTHLGTAYPDKFTGRLPLPKHHQKCVANRA